MGETGNPGGFRRDAGLKPLDCFSLKGLSIYSRCPEFLLSGNQEIMKFLSKTRPFLLS
ncbi:MAG: hypothetical protein GX571_00590 [Lentisphaerae bacterium]|nr:hypothetical protein [Lentisphaerota bacterium]